MPDQRELLVRKMVAEGTSDDDILATLKAYDAQQPAAPAPKKGLMASIGEMVANDPQISGITRIAKAAIAHPVQAGAIAGGLATAPFTGGASIPAAMAAAGLGAAGGAGLGSIASAAMGNEGGPQTAGDVAKAMATEGALGAVGEGVGQGAARAATKVGKLVYKTALRPSMGLQREFGDVAATGVREGAPVSESGVTRIAGRMRQSADTAKQMVADAEAAGASPVTTKEVASEFGDVFRQGRNQASLGRTDPRQAVLERLQNFDTKNPNGIPLSRAQELKSEAQDLASRAYRAQDLGHPITDLSAASDAAMARGLKQGIEARVPGIQPVNARTQELIGLSRALEDANRRNVPGVGSLRSLLGDFMPAVSSQGGIALDRLGNSAALPASFKTALIAALSGGQ